MQSYVKVKKTRLKGAAWKRRRQECFVRDRGICQYCTRPKSEYMDAISPHHRVFKSQGGDDLLDNLATACVSCHYEHGRLKNKPLLSENGDMAKMNELVNRYKL